MPGMDHIFADGGQEKVAEPALEQTVEKFLMCIKVREAVQKVAGSVDMLIQRQSPGLLLLIGQRFLQIGGEDIFF